MWLKRKPKLSGRRLDYIKTHWGKSIGWESKGKEFKGHLWSPWGLRVGDRINVGAGQDLLIVTLEQCRDPRDMYFFTARAFEVDPNEPASFGLSGGDWV